MLNLSKCGILEITVTFCNAWSLGFCVIPKICYSQFIPGVAETGANELGNVQCAGNRYLSSEVFDFKQLY